MKAGNPSRIDRSWDYLPDVRLRELEAAVPALEAAHLVARRRDALCRCVAEFAPGDMAACAERRDHLDTAIVALRAALGYPEDGER